MSKKHQKFYSSECFPTNWKTPQSKKDLSEGIKHPLADKKDAVHRKFTPIEGCSIAIPSESKSQ
jgi:hypothetical protein